MTIFQNLSQAIIDWQSFNIGTNASVYFNQQGHTSWVALNRIWDNSPTQIFGRLTADGQVYLINQNGILFAPGSQVNVHALVASSLNLSIDNFLASSLTGGTQQPNTTPLPLTFNTQQGTMSAKDTNNNYIITDAELQGTIYANRVDTFYNQSNPPGTASNPGVVSNAGAIQTDINGSVFLIGPTVENSGSILAPSGQIGLVAATDVQLESPAAGNGSQVDYPGIGNTAEARTALVVAITNGDGGYTATNLAGGLLATDTGGANPVGLGGLVGMYGNIVNQNGIIRSIAGVQNGGHVELFASDLISTGPDSVTSTPVSSSPDLVDVSFPTEQSSITLSGLLGPGQLSLYNEQGYGANLIVHQGAIISPSGLVTMNATSRVYLAQGSLIDVSGLWVDEPASAGLLSVQMNSANLRDYYIQQGGVLQGQYINITALSGSAIGDVSGAFATEGLTAMERHTAGGQVDIQASTGDIVVMQGSVINFSGGGINYGAGDLNTTELVSAGKVYNIATASADVVYESILNTQTFTNTRFGTTTTYNGIYYGGAVPMNQYVQAYTVGSNAGILSLIAPTIVLDGIILGFATNGLQQVLAANPTNPEGNQSADGYIEAMGGTLIIGNTTAAADNGSGSGDQTNFSTTAIVVSGQTGPVLPATFQPTDSQGNITPLPSTTTVLPAATLSNAGLSTLSLAANTTITVQQGAQITLNPGGTFNAWARRIEEYGGITALGGSINLAIQTDMTTDQTIGGAPNPNYVPLDGDMIYIGQGASLVARGERIDNTTAAGITNGVALTGYTNGGSINILDETVSGQGVAVMSNALIDVSGGWVINSSGKVTGGNAGSLTMQGNSLVLEGTLQAQSLVGNKGGAITLTAPNVTVAAAAPPFASFAAGPFPDSVQGQLVLGPGLLDASGFTNITLNSVNDLIVESGASLGPSLVKLATPVPGSGTTGVQPGAAQAGPGVVLVSAEYIGGSSITLNAGKTVSGLTSGSDNPSGNGPLNPVIVPVNASALVYSGASIQTAPGGSITVTAPNTVEVGGSLSAPAGTITLKASGGAAGSGDVTLDPGASVLAEGYNEAGTTSTVQGLAAEAVPLSGGSVSIISANNLILSPGSLVSVSGSSPVEQTLLGQNNTVSYVMNASQPGSISLSAGGTISLSPQADLEGQAAIAGLPGGTLSVSVTGTNALSLAMSDLARFQAVGFDALTLSSAGTLILSNPSGIGQVAFGRSLTLSAQTITGSGTDQIDLGAPWVQVVGVPSQVPTLSAGGAEINLIGKGIGGTGWLDVTGSVAFSGFQSVYLSAAQDITLTEELVSNKYYGTLAVSGDLTLQAARIYPTTLSSYTINAGGMVTILPSGTTAAGPVYSAGGSLTINAGGAGIDQEGYLAAPMGSISLSAPNGRVYLGSGSTTTVSGGNINGNASLLYGTIQMATDAVTLGDNIWAIPDKANPLAQVPYTAVQNVPAESVSLSGSEVIVGQGALVDVSGGGSIFASRFVPSYSGSNDPLAGSYVVVPGIVLPGNAVYLSGMKGLPAGTYSLLPAVAVDANGNVNPSQWAYLPGAMVVTDLKTNLSTDKATLTPDGYPIIGGYATVMGTNISSPQLEAYEVRPASLVLSEGLFNTQSLTAGAGGSVTLTGNTTILNGTIRANPLPGFPGGTIALSGNTVVVEETVASLPSDFGFDTPVPVGLADTLTIAAPSLSGQGFQTIGLGVSDLTGSVASVKASTVEIEPNVVLQAENIILGAANSITLDAGAQVLALALPGDTGEATFISPNGMLSIGANGLVHASNGVNLQVANTYVDPTATIEADHSSLDLQGSAITIVQGASQATGPGLFLTINQWDNLSSIFENITLTSLSDLVFGGSFTLAPVADTLTIDAGRIMDSVANGSVILSAQTIALQNTTGAIPSSSPSAAGGQITFNASQIQVNQGSILFDGFSNVNMKGQNNVTFSGAGSLTTGGGNLTIATPRVATSYYVNSAGTYTAANYLIDTTIRDASGNVIGGGTVSMAGTGAASASTAAPGGTFAITAGEIDISTIVEVPSGQIDLTATGNINLESGGQLLGRGYYTSSTGQTVQTNAPGGVVSLTSTNGGAVNLMAGSLIDVSAGSQGDAGSITLYAPIGGVALNGNIQGQAAGGSGGSFSIVTNTLDTIGGVNYFSTLNQSLAAGGFNDALNIEASYGNITIAASDDVQARSVTITADGTNPDGTSNGGSIILSGTIDVSQLGQGGTVGLYAQNDLTIYSSGYIDAHAIDAATNPDATGGNVTLSVNTGLLTLAGGFIDVSGATGNGGTVTFRDPPPPPGGGTTQSDMSLSGTVKGASSVVAEIDEVYENQFQGIDATGGTGTVITAAAIAQIQTDLTNLMNADSGLATELPMHLTDGNGNALTAYNPSSNPTGTFHLQPGVVIEQTVGNGSDGDITLSTDWNFYQSTKQNWLFGSGKEPGTLTLRAAGNLNINGNLISAQTYTNNFSDYSTLLGSSLSPSWGFNLVAGANTASANPMAVAAGGAGGSLTISADTVVYTETGALRFASAGDTVINQGPSNGYMIISGMNYSLATYKGDIIGNVGGNLTINAGGAVQSATGNIDISVGGNLNLNEGFVPSFLGYSLGSIRTTGETTDGNPDDYTSYAGGGSITLNVGGSVVSSALNPNAWLTANAITPTTTYYQTITPTYGTTAPDGEPSPISTEGIVTMAGGSVYVRSGGSFYAQTGTFGQGDLQVYSGGDLTGRFLVNQGTGTLSAMGNFGEQDLPQLIEMSAANINVSAQGSIYLGAALNPGLAAVQYSAIWNNGYTPGSSLSLTAVTGDVDLYGTVDEASYGSIGSSFYDSISLMNMVLPASVAISAGRDINVMGQLGKLGNAWNQLPSPTGELTMSAGRDIVFSEGASWVMSDAPLTSVYGIPKTNPSGGVPGSHASPPIHTGDSTPVMISAGGDITDADLTLPKMAMITAGQDIQDITYNGQNIGSTDVTLIQAGGSILFGSGLQVGSEGIQVGGPGYLIVEAGGKIDLGYSEGIQEVGNTLNPALTTGGPGTPPPGSVIVAAGIDTQLNPQDVAQFLQNVAQFFASLESKGIEYSTDKAAGDSAGAQAIITNVRADIIGHFLGAPNPSGDIDMTSSQIATSSGGAIYALATGAVDVGTTELVSGIPTSGQSHNTGILTELGGDINIFATGDVNVNTSRVMTFLGGDITVWSDQGSINAGKGDKATISVSPPKVGKGTNGVLTVTFNPPAVGSGIRALTYAPNPNTPAPSEGNIYLFAPSGDINAGEAGISGAQVFLGANTILNASNISSTVGSVGLPPPSQGVSLGALTGTSDLTKGSISADTGALATAQERVASAQPIEDMVVKWIDVKVMSYDLTFGPDAGSDDSGEGRDKKKNRTDEQQ
jgi:filamentous hemagglutinin family protein